MRLSALYAPTLREPPSDADAPSLRLLLQAGYLRRSAGGTYSWLPLGLRALHRVAAVVREEMERTGAQEISLPILQPADLWRQSGRWDIYGDELFRLKDRHGRDFVLGPTHEELVTELLRGEVRSYRQLPLCLFQIGARFRDEVRPRFGVMRGREFMMKDAYSFDRDETGLDRAYKQMLTAYGNVFRRLGLMARPALADPGAIGGNTTHEFVVSSAAGEARLVSCAACGYLANVEGAAAARDAPTGSVPPASPAPALPRPVSQRPARIDTPGMHTVEAVCDFLGVPPAALIKTMIVLLPDGTPAVGLVRGDHELSPDKLARALGVGGVEMAGPAVVEQVSHAPVGFAGPIGLRGVPIIADHAVAAMEEAVTGANEADAHLAGVVPARDFRWAAVADIRLVGAGDPCPECGAPLSPDRGIEVGQVFKLGTRYSERLGATYADEDGTMRPMFMGCYGIGISRTLAAIVETHHDRNGICWPLAAAPFQVLVLPVNDRDAAQIKTAEAIYGQLGDAGVDALLDDRAERAGVKFKDADLQGWPLRVTVGPRGLAEGYVELRERATGVDRRLGIKTAGEELAAEIARVREGSAATLADAPGSCR
jgi:prolyl-tRNA synthetase